MRAIAFHLCIRPSLSACLFGCLMAGAFVPAALAQERRPAGLQPIEEVDERPVPSGAAQAPRNTEGETRLPGGRVTEIEVNRGTSTYYLRPQTAAGGVQRDSGRTVQWNVFNFDLPARRSERSTAAPDSAAPVPPPPRAD